MRVNVRLVRVIATVKDPSGALVGSLEKPDFTIRDNGVPQEISVFERRTEQPLSVALLIDNSGSTAKDLKYEVDSVTRFLRALFRRLTGRGPGVVQNREERPRRGVAQDRGARSATIRLGHAPILSEPHRGDECRFGEIASSGLLRLSKDGCPGSFDRLNHGRGSGTLAPQPPAKLRPGSNSWSGSGLQASHQPVMVWAPPTTFHSTP